MEITTTPLADLLIIKPAVHHDARGYFLESFQAMRYANAGIPNFVQDNQSRSKKNVLRGLHYQLPNAQGKLVYVTHGNVFDVAVDLRKNSPTFSKWFGIELSSDNHLQVYIPPGFAHGFCVLSDIADFHYKCTTYYQPQAEHGILWNDPDINIEWPVKEPILAPKDKSYPYLKATANDALFA